MFIDNALNKALLGIKNEAFTKAIAKKPGLDITKRVCLLKDAFDHCDECKKLSDIHRYSLEDV